MKRTFLYSLRYSLVVCLLAITSQTWALNLNNETLRYQIVFHWGMIWKHAGDATLSIRNNGNGYNATLTAKTRSWADKVYPVRDTLSTKLTPGLRPLVYTKSTHEKNYYARDVIRFSYPTGKTVGTATRYREGKRPTTKEHSTQGAAYDMLSVFYMLRTMNFNDLSRSKVYNTTIFSGSTKENLAIRYHGIKTIKMRNGERRQAHHISFVFTQDGKKKSSDDINTYLSTDGQFIPLLLQGSLPVGEVRCYLAS